MADASEISMVALYWYLSGTPKYSEYQGMMQECSFLFIPKSSL